MAHLASDGTPFTNRPAMHSHNARMASKKPRVTPADSNPKGRNADMESGHQAEHDVTCPHCGSSFDAGEIAAGRDENTREGAWHSASEGRPEF